MASSRQLAAIFFSDIAGYTALMGRDEQQALKVLEQNRSLHDGLIKKYNGRLLKEMGDGILASFETTTDAVYCAGAIQKAAGEYPDLNLRIGIHQGEVVFTEKDVFGDGVNIASRIESITPTGGIWVSESVSGNLQNKKGIKTTFIKEKILKNIKDPVRIYEVVVDIPLSPDDAGRDLSATKTSTIFTGIKPIHFVIGVMVLVAAFFLYKKFNPRDVVSDIPTELSIAVLPFDNFSQQREENQYLCDGFLEEILNQLSKINSLQVRSRSSVEQYRDNRPTIPEIGQKLDVSHILEGSVQKIGDELKVAVQLIVVDEDKHIWQDSYNEEFKDIFRMQSKIAHSIAEELKVQLTPQEEKFLETPPTENIIAYDYYLRAFQYGFNWELTRKKSDFENAVLFFQKAEREDPKFARAMISRASMYRQGWIGSESLRQEIDVDSVLILCNRAIAIEPEFGWPYSQRGWYYEIKGEIEKAKMDYEKALSLNVRNWGIGQFYFRNQDYIKGLKVLHKSEILFSGDEQNIWLYHILGYNYLELGDVEQAWAYWDHTKSIQPGFEPGFRSQIDLALCQGEWSRALELLQTYQSLYPQSRLCAELFGMYYLHTGDYEKGLEYFENGLNLSYEGRDYIEIVVNHTFFYGIALSLNGRNEEGEKLINECLNTYLTSDRLTTQDREVRIAGIYAFLGNKQEAYQWLHKSKWTNTALYEIQQDIWFSSMNKEPEFREIVDSVQTERRGVRQEIARLKAAGEW